MVTPVLPNLPTGTTRTKAAGPVAAAAGDFTADLDALLAEVSGVAAGLAALLAVPPAPGTTAPPPTGEAADPASGLPAQANAAFRAIPASIGAAAAEAGGPVSLVGPRPWATSPSPTGGTAAPTSGPRPGAGEGADGSPVTLPAAAAAAAVDATAELGPETPTPAGTGTPGGSPSPAGPPNRDTRPLRPGVGPTPATARGTERAAVIHEGAPAAGAPHHAADTVPPTPQDPLGSGLPADSSAAAAPGGLSARPGAAPAQDPSPAASTAIGPTDAAGAPVASTATSPTAPAADRTDQPVEVRAVPARIADITRRRSGPIEQLVVRLDPPELGTVRITVTARGDQVHVALRAATPEARAALAAQRESIETLLSGEGFDLGSFDVGHQRRDDGRPAPRRGAAGARDAFSLDATEPVPSAPAPADGALRL